MTQYTKVVYFQPNEKTDPDIKVFTGAMVFEGAARVYSLVQDGRNLNGITLSPDQAEEIGTAYFEAARIARANRRAVDAAMDAEALS